MSLLFALFALLAVNLPALASTRINATLVLTNIASNSFALTLNSATRTWATNVTTPATQIHATNSIPWSVSNLYAHIVAYPFTNITVSYSSTNANAIELLAERDIALSVTLLSNWATVSYSTNTVSAASPLLLPITAYPSNNLRTNFASLLVSALAYSTNPITYADSVSALRVLNTNGFATNLTAYGFITYSPTNNSSAFGSNVTVTGTSSVGMGYGSIAAVDGSSAYGYLAKATNNASTALGRACIAGGSGSVSVGINSVAIGENSAAYGLQAYALHSNSIAIGLRVTTTSNNQILIGSFTNTVTIPGNLELGGRMLYDTNGNAVLKSLEVTNNSTTSGTNFAAYFSGDGSLLTAISSISNSVSDGTNYNAASLYTKSIACASVANGPNILALSNAPFMTLSGPTADWSLDGVTPAENNRTITLYNYSGQTMTLKNESGLSASASARISTGTGADVNLPDSSFLTLWHNPSLDRWSWVAPYFGTNTIYEITNLTEIIAATNNLRDLLTNGSSFNGSFAGDGALLTNAYAASNLNQFVTLAQLQSWSSQSELFYADSRSNAASIGLSGSVLRTNWAWPTLPASNSVTIADLDSGEYLCAFLSADTYTSLNSGLASVDLYAYETGAGTPSVTAEFYIWNTATAAEEYEFSPPPVAQALPNAEPSTPLTFSVPITDYTSTTNFRVLVKIKRTDAGNNNDVILFTGGARPTHLAFSVPGSFYASQSQLASVSNTVVLTNGILATNYANTVANLGSNYIAGTFIPAVSNTIVLTNGILASNYANTVSFTTLSNKLLNLDVTNNLIAGCSNLVLDLNAPNLEIQLTNNIILTNWIGCTDNVIKTKTIFLIPVTTTRTVTYPADGAGYAIYWHTNSPPSANRPYTSLTNGSTYVLSVTARGTNLYPSMTEWK